MTHSFVLAGHDAGFHFSDTNNPVWQLIGLGNGRGAQNGAQQTL